MKKTIANALFLLAFSLAATAAGGAQLLYFLVDGYSPEGPQYNFDYAVLGVTYDGGTPIYLEARPTADSGATASKVILADNSGTYSTTHEYLADITDYSDPDDGYVFFIATYKYGSDDPIWGYSAETAQSYSQLLAAHHIAFTDHTEPNLTPWVVPEPSSGMLLLLGLAGLGLRRRRKSM